MATVVVRTHTVQTDSCMTSLYSTMPHTAAFVLIKAMRPQCAAILLWRFHQTAPDRVMSPALRFARWHFTYETFARLKGRGGIFMQALVFCSNFSGKFKQRIVWHFRHMSVFVTYCRTTYRRVKWLCMVPYHTGTGYVKDEQHREKYFWSDDSVTAGTWSHLTGETQPPVMFHLTGFILTACSCKCINVVAIHTP